MRFSRSFVIHILVLALLVCISCGASRPKPRATSYLDVWHSQRIAKGEVYETESGKPAWKKPPAPSGTVEVETEAVSIKLPTGVYASPSVALDKAVCVCRIVGKAKVPKRPGTSHILFHYDNDNDWLKITKGQKLIFRFTPQGQFYDLKDHI